MTPSDIARLRLLNQQITVTKFTQPAELVAWLGAVQAQDYLAAKWALGLRLPGAVDDEIERAFAAGAFLRTHVMRPTWHFVAPADIRWMLALTAPRVLAISDYYYRKTGLDAALFARSNDTLARALQGGHERTRDELRDALEQTGIALDDPLRLGYILMRAELEGLICSGARRGKQFTYALLDERVPPARTLERDEALAELTRRYFISHGPATARDFAWWSGLTVTDAQRGLAIVGADLQRAEIAGQTYWLAVSALPPRAVAETAHLLPNFDEYAVGYRGYDALFQGLGAAKLVFRHPLLMAGQMAGGWKRSLTKGAVIVEMKTLAPLTESERQAVGAAAERYGAFLGLPVEIVEQRRQIGEDERA
jgi:Winged helix DNA-binding domain